MTGKRRVRRKTKRNEGIEEILEVDDEKKKIYRKVWKEEIPKEGIGKEEQANGRVVGKRRGRGERGGRREEV